MKPGLPAGLINRQISKCKCCEHAANTLFTLVGFSGDNASCFVQLAFQQAKPKRLPCQVYCLLLTLT